VDESERRRRVGVEPQAGEGAFAQAFAALRIPSRFGEASEEGDARCRNDAIEPDDALGARLHRTALGCEPEPLDAAVAHGGVELDPGDGDRRCVVARTPARIVVLQSHPPAASALSTVTEAADRLLAPGRHRPGEPDRFRALGELPNLGFRVGRRPVLDLAADELRRGRSAEE